MKIYIKPTIDEMPSELASIMGMIYEACHLFEDGSLSKVVASNYNPMEDHNDSQIALEFISKLGLMDTWANHLIHKCTDTTRSHIFLATPAEKSNAAHRTLWNHYYLASLP